MSFFFWMGIMGLFDGSLALLFQERWQKRMGALHIQRIALVEIGVGLAFLTVHYLLKINPQ